MCSTNVFLNKHNLSLGADTQQQVAAPRLVLCAGQLQRYAAKHAAD
jgi:hypothetical protein